jgi:hypothetical protein
MYCAAWANYTVIKSSTCAGLTYPYKIFPTRYMLEQRLVSGVYNPNMKSKPSPAHQLKLMEIFHFLTDCPTVHKFHLRSWSLGFG